VLLAAFQRGGAWQRRAAASAVALAIVALSVVPHRYAFYRRYGDPFWDTSSYARAIANTEFAGQPGFPSRAEIAIDGDMGPPLTYRQYLFTLHTPTQVFRGTLVGFSRLFMNMGFCGPGVERTAWCFFAGAALQLLGVVGLLLAAVWRRRLIWIPIAFVLLELPVAFLYERNILELYRHTYQGFPLLVLAALLALDTAVPRRRKPESGSHVAALVASGFSPKVRR
jgi:hypothetical protein